MTNEPRPPADDFAQRVQALVLAGRNVGRLVTAITEAFQRARPGIISLIEAVQRMPDVMQAALVRLANEGWYLDWEGMSLQEPAELAVAYLEGRRQEVEERLVEHYRRRLPEIEEGLVEAFPPRAHIFRQSFNAHRQGLYCVSVPTLLAQADGVCLELLGEHFFMKSRGQKAEQFEKLASLDVLTKSMLAPFFSKTSIRLTDKKRPEGFDKLNRHLVLHGESLDYGTEVRSLQAVAFLYYVVLALKGVLGKELPQPGPASHPDEGMLPERTTPS